MQAPQQVGLFRSRPRLSRRLPPQQRGVRERRGRGRGRGSSELGRWGIALLAGLVISGNMPVHNAGGQEGPGGVLQPATEPLLSIGVLEGDPLHELFNVRGAIRLEDGSVVAMVQGHYEIRRYGPDGRHLWSVGRAGEGPLEFQLPSLLPSCSADDRIVVYDNLHYRVSIIDNDGDLVDDYRLEFGEHPPYGDITCSSSGRLAFTRYADRSQRPSVEGPYRWVVDMAYSDGEGDVPQVFRSGIPGADRYLYFQNGVPATEGPQRWGRELSMAAVEEGVWMGTADGYEIELVGWTGETIDRIRWTGPELGVTEGHIETYREILFRSYERRGREDWRQRFNDVWGRRLPTLPPRFPSYTDILVSGDLVWVRHFRPPGQDEQHWVGFNRDGSRAVSLFLPSRFIVQQIGPDWVLAVITDELDVERIVVHELEERKEP